MKHILQGILCTIIGLGVIGCADPIASPTPDRPERGRLLTFTEQSQTCNAYDWLGWFHNQAMQYGLTYQNDYLEVAPITASYIIGDFVVDLDSTDDYDTSYVYPIAYSADSIRAGVASYMTGKTRAQIISGLPFSGQSKNVIEQLLSLVDDAYETPFLLKCDTLVASVNNNAAIDSSEKVMLLTVIAIGYHSFQFWDYYIPNGALQSFRTPTIFDVNPKEAKTKNVVEADIVGATVGAGIGALGGAVGGAVLGTAVGHVLTGGAGAAPGAVLGATFGFFRGLVTGAIAGALGTSAFEGIVKPMIEDKGEGDQPKKKVREGGP